MRITIDAITAINLVDQVENNVKNSRVVKSLGGRVSTLIDAVAGRLNGGDAGVEKISILRLWSHGWTHYQDGGDYPNGNIDFRADEQTDGDDLRFQNFGSFRAVLERLKPSFETMGSRAELRGCAIAKGNGKQMMSELAKAWGVEIHGSDIGQSQILSWAGQVWAASPDGTVRPIRGIETYESR